MSIDILYIRIIMHTLHDWWVLILVMSSYIIQINYIGYDSSYDSINIYIKIWNYDVLGIWGFWWNFVIIKKSLWC